MKKMLFYKKNKYSKGVVLVFAILLSVILFTFAAGVLNIATKELSFSTSGKNSNNSFYAADSGVECALFNDMEGKDVFVVGGGNISCFGNNIPSETSYPIFNFRILNLGLDGQSCAKVMVEKDVDIGSTQIISKGYNMGGQNKCEQFGLNSIERVIEVNY